LLLRAWLSMVTRLTVPMDSKNLRMRFTLALAEILVGHTIGDPSPIRALFVPVPRKIVARRARLRSAVFEEDATGITMLRSVGLTAAAWIAAATRPPPWIAIAVPIWMPVRLADTHATNSSSAVATDEKPEQRSPI
jgi:hypothetical protein